MQNNTQVFHTLPQFTESQLRRQAEKQKRFLLTIHPFLADEENYNEGCIELRPIKRESKLKYLRSFNTWHLREKDIDKLVSTLNDINGNGYCFYYSTFAFDYEKEVQKKNGKPFEKGKINNQNALFTTVLVMDFDEITYETFMHEKQQLLDLGIETIDVFTGHGFQSIILLNQRVYETTILKHFTELLLSKGFKIDPAVIDAARVMRMPYSFNAKALDSNNKYYDPDRPEIHPTTDINWTDKRYDVLDVFTRINTLPDQSKSNSNPLAKNELENMKTAPLVQTNSKDRAKEATDIQVKSLASVYDMIDYDTLPIPIKKMLTHTPISYRNKVMLFLIPFFRNTLGLNIEIVKDVFKIWANRCDPPLETDFVVSEVDRLWAYDIHGRWGKYDEEMETLFGPIQFDQYKRDNKIVIPNSIFEEFNVISNTAIRIYFAMKLAEKRDEVKNFSIEDILFYSGISKKTFHRNIDDLLKFGYVSKRKRKINKKKGEKYIYYLNPYYSVVEGFTLIETLLIKDMLRELTGNELKLYSYLVRMTGSYNKERDVWASQSYLATKVGTKRNTISELTTALDKKRYITKTTTETNKQMHSTYNLNY